jgi:hypothetical protein
MLAGADRCPPVVSYWQRHVCSSEIPKAVERRERLTRARAARARRDPAVGLVLI